MNEMDDRLNNAGRSVPSPVAHQKPYHHRAFHISPNRMRDLLDYINNGNRPGMFLCAVLRSNLIEACTVGGDDDVTNLAAYAAYLQMQAPEDCWGGPAIVEAWIDRGGLEGQS